MTLQKLPSLAAVLALAGVLSAARPVPGHAQQLLAWPMGGQNVLRMILPGQPIRPLPPPTHRPLPRPRPGPGSGPHAPPEATPLEFSGYRVEGSLEDQVANLTYHINFHNPTGQRLEGVLILPVPADTVLNGFTMTMGGRMVKGELLEAGQATTIYENIVRSMRDPGLLEMVGERLVRARVFPIEPNGDISVRFTMTQVLGKSGGLVSLSVPLRSARMTQGEKGRAGVSLRLTASHPLRTLYSPNREARIERLGEREARITYEPGGAGEAEDLNLFYSLREDPLAAGLLAYKEEGEDGYFLLNLSPRPQDAGRPAPKDIVFIVDRSGSMEEGGKMDQARRALSYCLSRLAPEDRFGIVDFATDANSFEPRLVAATPANKARARRYVQGIDASGGTNIEAGLAEGLRLLARSPERVSMVFFLTDGLPTVGDTDVEALLRRAAEANQSLRARVFSFGVGSDVNTLFLDKLAQMNRGARDYVSPGEDIEHKVSALYQKVARPALTDARVEWRGIAAEQVYPRPVADLFFGSELVLAGRYAAGGKGVLVVTGRSAGRPVRFEFPVELPDSAPRHSFVPRLWANLKVGHELDAIRLAGRADPEVIADIVKLAKRHGIVTPYTSYLVTEEGRDLRTAQEAARLRMNAMSADAAMSGFRGGGGLAAKAQRASSFLDSMARGAGLFSQPQRMISGAASGIAAAPAPQAAPESAERETREELKRLGQDAAQTRVVGSKTFYRRGRSWVDGDFELADQGVKAATVEIACLSPEYFALLSRHPELNRYLALGPDVTVLHLGTAYRILEKP